MPAVDSNSFSRAKMVRSLDLISSTCEAREDEWAYLIPSLGWRNLLYSTPVCGCPSRSPTWSWRSAPGVAGAPLAGHQPSSCLLGSYCWAPRPSVSWMLSARLSPAGASLSPGQRSAAPPPWLPEWVQCVPGRGEGEESCWWGSLRTEIRWEKALTIFCFKFKPYIQDTLKYWTEISYYMTATSFKVLACMQRSVVYAVENWVTANQ